MGTEDARKKVIETRTCVEEGCSNTFDITQGEKDHYDKLGFFLPKRCSMCRMKNRADNKRKDSVQL